MIKHFFLCTNYDVFFAFTQVQVRLNFFVISLQLRSAHFAEMNCARLKKMQKPTPAMFRSTRIKTMNSPLLTSKPHLAVLFFPTCGVQHSITHRFRWYSTW